MLEISMAARSECGARSANEDALHVGDAGATRFAVLADGAGGHERGAEASRRVIERVAAELRASAEDFVPARLAHAVLAAHEELQRQQVGAEGQQRMHSTVVALWIDLPRDAAIWSHVGDTRLYRLRYGAVELLTADDSVVQRMLEGGAITAQQAVDHPMKNRLLAALGMQESIEPHTLPERTALEDGDAYLLCTDGWWGALVDADFSATLTEADSPEHWLDLMGELIAARGDAAQDNYSAIAVWALDPSESTQSMPEGTDAA